MGSFDAFHCRAEAFANAHGPVVPTRADPIDELAQPDRALALRVDMALAAGRDPELVRAHESAPDYPGAVGEGGVVEGRQVTVRASHEGRDPRYLYAGAQAEAWRTTGLYAAPGEVITLTVPESIAGQGLSGQIGIHGDVLWNLDIWERVPELLTVRPLDSVTTRIVSAFGGPLLIRVPVGTDLGDVTVEVSGAREAPRFVLGEDDAETFTASLQAPAPWASLETEKVIFFVPTSMVQGLEDPVALMTLWDQVMDAEAELAAIPSARPRAEIIVADRQISAGWMHSGYPIMSNIDAASNFVDQAGILASGEWGVLHELGHNHQWSLMQLPGATECTVNLWSVHASEGVLGLDRSVAHPALSPSDRAGRIQAYIDGGRDFEAVWSVWTCLETYLQLQEGFGWAPHVAMFSDLYQPLPQSTSWDTETRASEYAVAFATHVQRDLGPFFTAWGWPLSAQALTTMAALPAWTDDPMN